MSDSLNTALRQLALDAERDVIDLDAARRHRANLLRLRGTRRKARVVDESGDAVPGTNPAWHPTGLGRDGPPDAA